MVLVAEGLTVGVDGRDGKGCRVQRVDASQGAPPRVPLWPRNRSSLPIKPPAAPATTARGCGDVCFAVHHHGHVDIVKKAPSAMSCCLPPRYCTSPARLSRPASRSQRIPPRAPPAGIRCPQGCPPRPAGPQRSPAWRQAGRCARRRGPRLWLCPQTGMAGG